MSRTRGAGSWKRSALIVLCILLSFILALLIALTIYAESVFGKIQRVDGSDETISKEQLDAYLKETDAPEDDHSAPNLSDDEMELPSSAVDVIGNSENIINILLVGQDRRGGSGRLHSDAMILCTINKSAKTLTMTSFMRDMWVKIPGHFSERLNVSYMLGSSGFVTLNKTLEYNFGVQVDHNVEVDFSGFEKIIDLVGGIDIELTASEASYMNRRGSEDAGEPYKGDWELKEGVNHLTGEQALAYSRLRKVSSEVGSGDFGRTNRQRTVLTKLVEKAKTLSLAQLNDLINGVLPMIRTDMSNSDITGYVMELFPLLADLTIITERIPADGTWSYAKVDGKSVIKVNFKKNQQYLQTIIGE